MWQLILFWSVRLFTTIYWPRCKSLQWGVSIYKGLPPSQSTALACNIDELQGRGGIHLERGYILLVSTRYLPYPTLPEDRDTSVCHLVPCAHIVVTWLGYVWMCALEARNLWGQDNCLKEGQIRAWDGHGKQRPFAFEILKKAYWVFFSSWYLLLYTKHVCMCVEL